MQERNISSSLTTQPVRGSQWALLTSILCCSLFLLALFALVSGTPALSLQELGGLLFRGEGERLTRIVVLQLRLPQFVLGMLAGMMLGLVGVLLQDTLRNPIAGPELLGVSAGASVVVAAITILGLPVLLVFVPWLALCGALCSGAIVLYVARQVSDPVKLSLIGAALTALFNACIIVLVSLGNQNNISILYFYMVGNLANRTWEHVQLVLPWALIGIPLAFICARPLNILRLGDEVAEGLGMRVVRIRLLILLLCAGLVSAIVAVCGAIAFVALLAPHLSRQLLGTADARRVLPVAALSGAVLLAGADILSRQIFAPSITPVGLWTTILGAPLLLLLLRKQLWKRA